MSISNDPPELLITMTVSDAHTLVEDCDPAIHQIFAVMNQRDEDTREEFLLKMVNLLEFKKRVKDGVERALNDET